MPGVNAPTAVDPLGEPPGAGPTPAITSNWRVMARTFLENRLAIVGLGVIAFMVLLSFLGPVVWRTQQVSINLLEADEPPSWAHPLGTDAAGYDMLGRIMLGGQSALELGCAVAIVAMLIGSTWGAISGYAGGWLDALMMRAVDVLLSIPTLVLLLILATMFTPSVLSLILILGSLSWLLTSRLVRAEALKLRSQEYVEAARLAGCSRRRIVLRHVIPNALGVIVVQAAFEVADAILGVAYLSFLGLGIPPPHASWGDILSKGLDELYNGYWWMVYPVGLAIVLTVLGFYTVGNALRDALETRLQTR
ncbi:MAG TPA: ABC transporter permease [Nocardioidaceae bacterium]|nr:ABC transporter permease [Nocardioidaceae bacterium]